MRFFADLHIHSKYSNSTSKYMDLLNIALWGQLKGLSVIGSADFTHHLWRKELDEKLEPAEPGFFKLKDSFQKVVDRELYDSSRRPLRFVLSSEISTVFRRNGKSYRMHNLILAPSFEAVDKITKSLEKIGNIHSDGRPILCLDAKDLVAIVLTASSDCMIIPAHIWTPWYGALGSKTGFDSIQDCFEEQVDNIFAIETGLSSSIEMNSLVSSLDRFSFLCNSDAHSCQKIGREANFFDTEFSYFGIINALKKNESIIGVESYPEFGKYYGDGHRICGVVFSPDQSKKIKNSCPKCNKRLNIGVSNRVSQLVDRSISETDLLRNKSLRIVPLLNIISIVLGYAESSKRVQTLYRKMLREIGPELYILLEVPIKEIEYSVSRSIAKFIEAVRFEKITVSPGYDGVYGNINPLSS